MTHDFTVFVRQEGENEQSLDLQISGMKCASCVFRVKEALTSQPGVAAHIDLTSGRASVRWQGEASRAQDLVRRIEALGYGAKPLVESDPDKQDKETLALLIRCMIVSGVASALVMGLGMFAPSQVWVMAGVTLVALFYAGRPLFSSAWRALRHGHSNMDVPISIALLLTTGMSLFEIAHQGTYAYFDSVVMLLFILLIGRALDQKTRGKARAAALNLLSLFSGEATIMDGEALRRIPIRDLDPGMILFVAPGERIAADGEVTRGTSDVDPSIITGETVAQPLEPGDRVFGGMINLSAPIHVRVSAASGESLLGQVIRLMEQAEQGHARFVRLADRVAKLYTPAVFILSALTFLGWWLLGEQAWQQALLVTSTVLVITCPCAMGLAVPAVQVLASSRLFRRGILLKSADALERLAAVDTIIFDKTGTLTLGRPKLVNRADLTSEQLKLAASLASQSLHPLARAVVRAHGPGPVYAVDVTEHPGQGLEGLFEGQAVQLGRRSWCGLDDGPADERPEIWLKIDGQKPIRLAFIDEPRTDAADLVAALKKQGYDLHLLSGDRAAVVEDLAKQIGLPVAKAHLSPTEKCAYIEALRGQGRKVLMVGDGLNDAAALATADVSMSPSSALDMTQSAADLVFQGDKLAPVQESLFVAKRAERLVRQNVGLSLLYNVIAVPLAMLGLATPLLAAAAMSLSSLAVVLNAQRLRAS